MDQSAPDETLLNEFAAGEHAALGELARRYERLLLGLATGLLGGDANMACDAVQETWVRVIRFADRFDGRSSFKTWLYRIAINQCRTVKSRVKPVVAAAESPESTEAAPISADDKGWLREQVRQLSPDKRTVVLLCYHEGMTHSQAAEVLEVPIGTLKSRLHAALTTLRGAMASEAAR